MAVAFFQITEEAVKRSRLDCLKLIAHDVHVGREAELASIVENEMVGWVYTLQIQEVMQGDPQRSKFRFIQ